MGKELSGPLAYLAPPFGGGQLKKAWESARILTEEGRYVYDRDGNRQLQYAVEDPTWWDWAQGLVLGPGALPSAREWAANGFETESARYTAGYDAARKAGVDGDTYAAWWDFQKSMDGEAAGDNSIKGARAAAALEMDLTAQQQMVLFLAADKDYEAEMRVAKAAGVSDADLLQWWSVKDTITADEKGRGNANSRKGNVAAAALEMDLTAAQQMALFVAADKDYGADVAAARLAGIAEEDVLQWWSVKDTIKADGKGRTNANSRKGKVARAVLGMDLTAEQQMLLYLTADKQYKEDMAAAKAAWIPDAVLLYWWSVKDTFKADLNARGNAIPGSRKEKVIAAVRALGLTQQQERALLAAGVE
jgi:hypothetical protein